MLFNGNNFFQGYVPFSNTYDENASGQYFVSMVNGLSPDNPRQGRRASFADTVPDHKVFYSRYHKSKFFCSSCHDVSNPILGNLEFLGTPLGDGVTVLTTEKDSAYSTFTKSEPFLSSCSQHTLKKEGLRPFEMSQATWTYLEPCEGDFYGDGDVDGSDLVIFAVDFGRTDCAGDCEGDFDGDGDVDGSDLDIFATDFGRTDYP